MANLTSNRKLLVPARYYVRLAEILGHHGVHMSDLLGSLGLSEADLLQPDARIAFADVDRLVVKALEMSGRSDLGFELGKTLSVSTHSVVGFGMLSSPTLEHSLQFVARYFRLVMPSFRLRCLQSATSSELLFTPVTAMSRACLDFHLEAIAVAVLRDIDDLTNGERPRCRITLSIPEPPHVARYRAFHDVESRFGLESIPSARVELLADLRSIPLSLADPNSLQVAEDRCRSLIRQVTQIRQFSEWIVMTIREMGDGVPTLDELSKMLNLSTRTLNRYLDREGTRYRDLAGKAQFEMACERLTSGTQSVTEIAYSLGFHDSANFARAFRTRAGCSPSQYRLQHTKNVAEA
jgi:AraC-like DNA-binding protein